MRADWVLEAGAGVVVLEVAEDFDAILTAGDRCVVKGAAGETNLSMVTLEDFFNLDRAPRGADGDYGPATGEVMGEMA